MLNSGGGPLDTKARSYGQSVLVGVAFLIATASDSMSVGFLPLYAATLFDTIPVLDREVATGLPISAFWLLVATAQVTTSYWERGRERRGLLVGATALGVIGLAMAAMSTSLLWLAAARGVSGFGYGMILILVQDYLLRSRPPTQKTVASGIYLSLFFAGTMIGASLGGFVAGWLGYPASFAIGSAVMLGVAGLFFRLKPHVEEMPPLRLRPLVLLANRRLLALVLFGALPSRLLISGFVYFLVPLHLDAVGMAQVAITQVVMIYPLCLALTTVPWSRLVDRYSRPVAFTLAGVVMSGLAMLPIPLVESGLVGAGIALITLGLAQSIGMSPQVTVLLRIAPAEVASFGQTSVLGFYRVCERIGLVSGPLVVGWLLTTVGPAATMFTLFGLMTVSGAILAVSLHNVDRTDPRAATQPGLQSSQAETHR